MDIAAIQSALGGLGLDAWLLFDYKGSNPIARRLVGEAPKAMATRRWFYLIPRVGSPTAIMHVIEPHSLAHLPGETTLYRSWSELERALRQRLGGGGRVAMEYSPMGAIPSASWVDAGTIELVRSTGAQVVSSADLVQRFESLWDVEQKALHDQAAKSVLTIKDEAFALVHERLSRAEAVLESEVQQFISSRFAALGLLSDHPCIVAVNEHASDPHFETAPGPGDRRIQTGDLLLIDLWAKLAAHPRSVYYDTTWMAFCGRVVPDAIEQVWRVVAGARDAALAYVEQGIAGGRDVRGCDVDDVARGYIEARGYGPYFLHRTGHSIGVEVHGNGVNLDNLETRDERTLLPGSCCSIEPGIYLPAFGIRSEIDVYVGEDRAELTGDIQRSLTRLA